MYALITVKVWFNYVVVFHKRGLLCEGPATSPGHRTPVPPLGQKQAQFISAHNHSKLGKNEKVVSESTFNIPNC